MTEDQLSEILKIAGVKEKDGYHVLPEGATLTLYIAKNGASLNVPKIEAIKIDGDMVLARGKKELFFVAPGDIFGAGLETTTTAGQPLRRAGFG